MTTISIHTGEIPSTSHHTIQASISGLADILPIIPDGTIRGTIIPGTGLTGIITTGMTVTGATITIIRTIIRDIITTITTIPEMIVTGMLPEEGATAVTAPVQEVPTQPWGARGAYQEEGHFQAPVTVNAGQVEQQQQEQIPNLQPQQPTPILPV